ncbi:conserved exported hypothetical protein [Candidatus Sulfopaludibacter sp. SbA3]|nr:conserved exported hypothetical protein [Candidatus Sulfopaludibacter sp. SbA3]
MRLLRFGACLLTCVAALAQPHHWTEAEANDWYAKQPWLVGANFIPSTASNQLEMWQQETFDPVTIDRELGWAQDLGMNTMRVFLHDLLWKDQSGFERRLNVFLRLADKHKMRVILVLFDSCWDPFPELGTQRAPRPGIHNSRWLQSPGAPALQDVKQVGRLMSYVQDLLHDYANDKRILAWDLWNEPDNGNGSSYGKGDLQNKKELVAVMLAKAFDYARAGMPTQPLTSGVWDGDWSDPAKLSPIQKVQLQNSDLISFHNYGKPEEFEKRVQALQQYHRPILCTEYMARPRGSTFQGILPIAKKYNVAAYNWGLVLGKTQTNLPWDSWQHPYLDASPEVWFHDIFHDDGVPHNPDEVAFIKQITARGVKTKSTKK